MTLVTPARFFHGEGECMFDTRPLHDAADPPTASVGVFNHHRSLQEHGPSRPRYNTEAIQKTFLASGQTDHDRLEEMTTLGVGMGTRLGVGLREGLPVSAGRSVSISASVAVSSASIDVPKPRSAVLSRVGEAMLARRRATDGATEHRLRASDFF